MELGFVLNHDLPSPKQRSAWYRGKKSIKSLDTEIGELSGHELDEMIDEILTDPELKWTGKNGITSFLGFDMNAVKDTIWTWNKHKF